MAGVFGLKPFQQRGVHINPQMIEGDVPLLRSKAQERQWLTGGGVVPFGVDAERNGKCDHPVAEALLKSGRQVLPEDGKKCLHNLSALLRQGVDIFLYCIHFDNLYPVILSKSSRSRSSLISSVSGMSLPMGLAEAKEAFSPASIARAAMPAPVFSVK